MTILYIFLLATGASFVQRTTGFGFGIFIMTALPFLMPSYGEATALSGLLALTTSIAIVARFRKYITLKRLLPILLTFIIVSAIAISLLTKIEGRTMRLVLGVLLILISLYFSFFKDRIRQYIRPTLPTQIGAGTLSGIMGGLFGMQGHFEKGLRGSKVLLLLFYCYLNHTFCYHLHDTDFHLCRLEHEFLKFLISHCQCCLLTCINNFKHRC